MKMQLLFGVLLLVCLSVSVLSIRKQSVRVKGKLMCGSKPATNVRVLLVDEDSGPDPDDELDEGHTDSKGFFDLSGSETELFSIDPRLKIYHDCADGKPCQRKVTYSIPDKYINDRNGMNLGTLNLEPKQKDEDRDCFRF